MKNLKINRYTILLLGSLLISLAGVGCKHTVHGAGQDIEHVGEKIQEKTE